MAQRRNNVSLAVGECLAPSTHPRHSPGKFSPMQSKPRNPVYSGLAAMWRPSIDEMQRNEERE
jgi:hypothetical protein